MHTLEEVQAVLKAAVERKPNNRNPYSHAEGSCLNTGKQGNHCIAAQVLVDLGYEVPAYGDEENGYGFRNLLDFYEIGRDKFDAKTEAYLSRAQGIFDEETSYGNSQRRQWKTCYNRLNRYLEVIAAEDSDDDEEA